MDSICFSALLFGIIFFHLYIVKGLCGTMETSQICKMSNCEAFFCHLWKAPSGGGTCGRAELKSGGAAGRYLTTCHKVLFTWASCKVQAHFSHLSLGRVCSPEHSWQVPQTLYIWYFHGWSFLEVRISDSGRTGTEHEMGRKAASCRGGSTGPGHRKSELSFGSNSWL